MPTDLWPDDIGRIESLAAPVTVLREQAALLSQKTDGLIEGEVRTHVQAHDFAHEFFLVVPVLNFHRHRLFSVTHGLDKPFYPVVLHLPGESLKAADLGEFRDRLKAFFASPMVRDLIETFIVQST